MGYLKLLNVQGIIGLVSSIGLAVLLLLSHGETRHWHKQSDRYEQLYNQEHLAFGRTVLNYQQAAEKARTADAANKARVEREATAVAHEREISYEVRIAAARAHAGSLRHDAAATANPGGAGTAPVSGLPGAPGGPNGPSPEAGLSPDDALTATEQAIQLDELIKWVRGVAHIDVNGQP